MDENGLYSKKALNEPILECRTCLHIMSPSAVLFNIFEVWSPPWDGMGNTIAEDLEKLANVKVQQTDKNSKVICRTCYELLHSACTFTAVVKRSDQILSQRFIDQEADKLWPRPIQIDKSMNSLMHQNSMNIEIKQEVLSDNEYENANGIYENGDVFPEMDIKVEPEEMIQQQPMQEFTLNGTSEADMTHLNNGDSLDHLLSQIKDEPLTEDEMEPMHADLPLECLLCAKDFNTVTGLKAHVVAQHSYKSVKRKDDICVSSKGNKCNYTCPICRQSFPTSADLIEHETKCVCNGCNNTFDSFELYSKHRQMCKALACQEAKKLKTSDNVLRPQPQEQVNIIKCMQCDETFTDMYYVTIHQEVHHSTQSDKTELLQESAMEIEALENIFSDHSNLD